MDDDLLCQFPLGWSELDVTLIIPNEMDTSAITSVSHRLSIFNRLVAEPQFGAERCIILLDVETLFGFRCKEAAEYLMNDAHLSSTIAADGTSP